MRLSAAFFSFAGSNHEFVQTSLTFTPGCVACAPSANAFACRITSGIANGDDVADHALLGRGARGHAGEVDRVLAGAEVLGHVLGAARAGRHLELDVRVLLRGGGHRVWKPNDVAKMILLPSRTRLSITCATCGPSGTFSL